MRSIKWCHFQWPWTNRSLVFKVTPLFDAKYLTNGYIYGHSYYRRRIGNRTQAFEWHQFQWLWVTSNPDFKVTILWYGFCCSVRERMNNTILSWGIYFLFVATSTFHRLLQNLARCYLQRRLSWSELSYFSDDATSS